MTDTTVTKLIKQAQHELFNGKRTEARRLASRAAQLAPEAEEPWLILAALGSPRGSVSYLKHILEINPKSRLAREAMHWAVRRHRQKGAQYYQDIKKQKPGNQTISSQETQANSYTKKRNRYSDLFEPSQLIKNFGVAFISILVIGLGFFLWFAFSNDYIALARAPSAPRPVGVLLKPSLTPTQTFTPTPTFTVTPSPTFTPSPTPTYTPTETYTSTIGPTITSIPAEAPVQPDPVVIPAEIATDEHWIDIDVSEQRLSAYTGNELIRSFIISSGTWYTPTPLGQFHIYAKYVAADMMGPGYYLPAVPHVMYFNGDYGIHGAYWHMNFGTPMSHGCVNMKLEDAPWLFDFASIGTLVVVHD